MIPVLKQNNKSSRKNRNRETGYTSSDSKGSRELLERKKKYFKELEEKRIHKVEPVFDFDTDIEEKCRYYLGEEEYDK